MVDYRELIRLKPMQQESSNTCVVTSVGRFRNAVADVWKLVQERGLT